MFDIKTKSEGDITVIELYGKLDAVSAKSAESSVLEIIATNKKVIVDMAECSYVSSAGLRFILLIAKQAARAGNKAVLSGVQEAVWDVITMTGFESVLEAFPSRKDAAAAFN